MTALPPLLPIFYAVDATGASLPFALLYTYAAGTTTPLATYRDAAQTQPNTNPVVCDANGQAIVYLPSGVAYKFSLTDQYGTVQPNYPIDNILSGSSGATGAAGSAWRNGSGVPSNSVGADGDYYLNTDNGDVYRRGTGVYGYVMNIRGPVGSSINAIRNGTFYRGLASWTSEASVPASGVTPTAPTIGAGHTTESSSAQLDAAQSVSVAVVLRGSVSQGFPIQVPAGTNIITFWTTCYLESLAALNSNAGYVKAYLYSATAATETLVGTYTLTATSPTAVWTQQSIDLTSYLVSQGDYGIRFEIQAAVDNIGGTAGTKGTITAVDDIQLLVSAAGVSGPAGATGPAGPTGPPGTVSYLQRTTFTSNGNYTTGPNTTWLDVVETGGGGAGAGYSTSTNSGGGGGGAGGTIRKRIAVTPSTAYVIVIGTGGIAGAVNSAGTAGTDTTFGATLVVAKGGAGGAPTGGSGAGGACDDYSGGGSVTSGATGVSTLSHSNITVLTAIPGASGGSGGDPNISQPGGVGGAADQIPGGPAFQIALTGESGGGGGGSSAWGQGGRGANNATLAPNQHNATVPAATSYGAGGGGGCFYFGTGAGANGASGICIIEEIRS